MPNYQIYFDINGVFHYEPIPLAYDDPVLIDDDLFNNVLISENINTDFESVKNYVEVLGHTWDVDYYSPSESTTVNGGTITPTFADLKTLEDGTAVGITLPTNATSVQILPDGYTQLEYIQSNGGAHYIDTGFKPNQNTGIIAKFQLLSSTGNQTPIFSRTSRNVASFGVFLDSNSKWTADYGTLRYTNSSIGAQNLINLNFDKNVVKFNNDSYTFDAQTFQGSSNLTIFGMNTGGTVANNARMNFYSCEIYDNGTLIRSFIPCKNPSGTIGLYDIVNSKFYTNVGSGGTFTAGPEVPKSTGININCLGSNKVVDIDDVQLQELSKDTEWIFQYVAGPLLPDGYTQLEYIQSSGSQYINTGFKPNQDTKISITVDFPLSRTTWLYGGRTSAGSNSLGFLCEDGSRYRFDYASSVNALTVKPTGKFTIDSDKNKCYINGELVFTATYKTFTSPVNMYIFNNNNNGSLSGGSSAKLYNCSIYDNGVLIRSFIPCKNASGTVGLYDSVNNQFYQNAGSGTFIAGPEISPIEDKGGPFWRFMGHQQAQATSYDDNPSSPFYVGDPIGSSSVGRIRIVLYGGEYDNIYSDDLAKQRADFEIYQRSRLNDSISMETIPIPWMDANIVISHRFGQKQEPSKYIVKSFSVDYATGGTMTINAISWYPYYEESEVV